jgi:hypothetical protein
MRFRIFFTQVESVANFNALLLLTKEIQVREVEKKLLFIQYKIYFVKKSFNNSYAYPKHPQLNLKKKKNFKENFQKTTYKKTILGKFAS